MGKRDLYLLTEQCGTVNHFSFLFFIFIFEIVQRRRQEEAGKELSIVYLKTRKEL